MLTVRQLLKEKPAGFFSVPLDATVLQALQVMAEHNVGAVLVMEGESLRGIFPSVITPAAWCCWARLRPPRWWAKS